MLFLLPGSAGAEDPGGFHLNIGFSSKAFVNVPREDIRVAIRILSEKVAKKFAGSADSKIYDSTAEIEQDLKAQRLDVAALTPEDFFEIGSRTPIEPVMVTATETGRDVELLLLTRRDSGLNTFHELRNRVIALPARIVQYGNMYFTWVETLAMRNGCRKTGDFFSLVRETKTPSLSLMQVFFRQADACVVTRQVFELASELNPQIGRELRVIERFGRLSGGIIVLRPTLRADRKRKLMEGLLTLHEDPEGRQMFVMFQLSRLIPYRPEYMRATEAFFEEHRLLEHRLAHTGKMQ